MKGEIIASGYIPNDESMEMLEEIDAVFKSGQSLLIFPEGTRAGWDGQVKIGIARFAQRIGHHPRVHQNDAAQFQKRPVLVQNTAAQNPL